MVSASIGQTVLALEGRGQRDQRAHADTRSAGQHVVVWAGLVERGARDV